MPDHYYVYPAYLLRDLPRASGRRVPSAVAVAEVTVEELVAAAKSLGFAATAEADKQYPRQAFRYEGRIRVTKKKGVSKSQFLLQVAAELQRRKAVAKK